MIHKSPSIDKTEVFPLLVLGRLQNIAVTEVMTKRKNSLPKYTSQQAG